MLKTKTGSGKRNEIEDAHQAALFEWAWLTRIPPAPDIEPGRAVGHYLFAIPNGGNRSAREGARLKAQGVKAGVSDTLLPMARAGYLSLWIEMKPPKEYRSKVSESQAEWIARMGRAGFMVLVCYGFDQAKDMIAWYIRQPPTKRH